MAANNSSGGKSRRFGIMRDNVRAISAILPDGTKARFNGAAPEPGAYADLVADMRALGHRESDEIDLPPPYGPSVEEHHAVTAPSGDR